MPKAVICAHYSSDRQSGETIGMQLSKCGAFCKQAGLTVADTYGEEAASGQAEGDLPVRPPIPFYGYIEKVLAATRAVSEWLRAKR